MTDFKIGEVVVNVKSQKQYLVINVLNTSLHVRKLRKTKVAKHGGEWDKHKFRKLTKLDKILN